MFDCTIYNIMMFHIKKKLLYLLYLVIIYIHCIIILFYYIYVWLTNYTHNLKLMLFINLFVLKIIKL